MRLSSIVTVFITFVLSHAAAFLVCPSSSLSRRSHTPASSSIHMTATGTTPYQLPEAGSFDEAVLNSKIPVLVDFHAIWCAPCKLLAPVMDKLAEEYEGKLKVVKVDCDTHKNIMNLYRARGLPLMIVFNEGKIVARHEGVLNFEKTVELLKKKLPQLA